MRILLADKRLWILLAAMIVLRLPNLNRPLSKHHEFNTAVVLINAESWQQAGGGKEFCYTPLLSYQGAANRVLEKGWHIDARGNHVYLSFGAGWYVLPYFLFKALHIPFTPLSLELLDIFIGLLTAILLYLLLFTVTGVKHIALAGTLLFVLLPAVCWYCGNGYVTTSIMLPLVIVILYTWHQVEKDVSNTNSKYFVTLFLSGILLCYFDWLAVFLLGTMALWGLYKAGTNKKYLWISIIALLSAVSGVLLVLMQFAGYLGWNQVLHYWQARFTDRSTDTSEFSLGMMIRMVIQNLITGYLPLFLLLPLIVKKNTWKNIKENVGWPAWALAAIIPYNGIFLNWSAQHEFAWMAFALIACIAVSIYLFPPVSFHKLKRILIAVSVISILQYYVINLPGPKSIKGDLYNQQELLGNWIKQHIDPSIPVFININNDKILEYYSKRTFNAAQNPDEAKALAKSYGISKAIWLGVKNGKVESVIKIFPLQY